MTTPYIDPNVIFASDAPEIDKPNFKGDPKKGWDVTRNNDGRPVIPQMNFVDNQASLRNLYIHEQGAALPFKDGIDYADGAVVLKDGRLKQWNGTIWVNFGQDDNALKIVNNLSDVPNKAAARSNLSVYSQAEVDTAISNATPTIPNATETIEGKAKIATTAIAQAGVDDTDIITAKKLRDALNASGEAPIYACRAWVSFNGEGNISIIAGGNVSSIVRNSTGDYTIYFIKPMPRENYFISGTVIGEGSGNAPASSTIKCYDKNSRKVGSVRILASYAYAGASGMTQSDITLGVIC